MLDNPKVGDRVILSDLDNRTNDAQDPLWGGSCGYVTGRIIRVDNADDIVMVGWNTGVSSGWYPFKLLSPATRANLLKEKIYKFAKTKWFGTLKRFAMVALLVVVVDFLFLKGRGLKALRIKLNSIIDKTLEEAS